MAIAKSITRYEPDDVEPEYKLTDVGNAERFVAMFKNEVKYCSVYKKWFIWNGKFWEQDEGTIVEYAIQCVRSIYTYADMLPAGDQRKALIQHAMRSESGNKIKLLITLAAGMKDLAIAPDDWDANPSIPLPVRELLFLRRCWRDTGLPALKCLTTMCKRQENGWNGRQLHE